MNYFFYMLIFRNSHFAHIESKVLIYHIFSVIILSVSLLLFLFFNHTENHFLASIACIFAHGIYSLTFLELWTLAQISYSKDIILAARDQQLNRQGIVYLVKVGDKKRKARLQALLSSGLVDCKKGNWFLTRRGRFLASFLNFILWLVSFKSVG